MSGTNCQLDTGSVIYGSISVLIDRLGYGKTLKWSEGEAAKFKAFYPMLDVTSNFYINVVHRNWDDYNTFNKWLAGFARIATDPFLGSYAPITVTVESRRFRQIGYVVSDMEFGDEFGKVIYSTPVTFVSAEDPLERNIGASQYVPALRDAVVNGPFYPSTTPNTTPPTTTPAARVGRVMLT